jgi:L-amino acid N-acyltransferase
VGFASFGNFRGEGRWPGYCFTVEHTIHVAETHWRAGVGRALLEAMPQVGRKFDRWLDLVFVQLILTNEP